MLDRDSLVFGVPESGGRKLLAMSRQDAEEVA
jgi:hypothetical protein